MAAEPGIVVKDEQSSIWNSLREMFSTGSEYETLSDESIKYQRKMLDYRIEAFLDKNFSDYVEEFGILDEPALDVRHERLAIVEAKAEGILHFVKEAEADLSDLEGRVDTLEKATKKK
jgi:hypothetical protein